MNEGNSPMNITCQKGAMGKNGEVAKIVEAASIGETSRKEESVLETSKKGQVR